MSRTKKIGITVVVVAAAVLGLAGVANASDYDSHVQVAGVDAGDVAHAVSDSSSTLGNVVHGLGKAARTLARTVNDAL